MRLPLPTAEAVFSFPATGGRGVAPGAPAGVVAQACSLGKKIGCGAAFIACGASCLLGPEVCVPCLAGVGATDCLDCLLN